VLLDREVTMGRVRELFTAISNGGPLDLFFLYLSGHGEVGADGSGWFCLADAEPGRSSLNGSVIDEYLAIWTRSTSSLQCLEG
jgi:uncharacterized caspase-like protein